MSDVSDCGIIATRSASCEIEAARYWARAKKSTHCHAVAGKIPERDTTLQPKRSALAPRSGTKLSLRPG
jgi:hypothetical protein